MRTPSPSPSLSGHRLAALAAAALALALGACSKDPALVGGLSSEASAIPDLLATPDASLREALPDSVVVRRDARRADSGPADMCTNTATDPANCGSCGHACDVPNAFPSCSGGICGVASCVPGWLDCNASAADGCETYCVPTGLKTCTKTADCGPGQICDTAKGRCDACNNVDNWCDCTVNEGFNLDNDPNNCGACGHVCSFPNAQAFCAAGKCTEINPATGGTPAPWPTDGPGPTCNAGFYDFPAPPACTSDADCPAGQACDPLADPSGLHHCDQGCPYSCTPDAATGGKEICNGLDDDCDGLIDDHLIDTGKACYPSGLPGCTETATSPPTYSCLGICATGTTACTFGTLVCNGYQGPEPEKCDGTDWNCDGDPTDGFDLMTDVHNCGACGNDCTASPNAVPNATMTCVSGMCAILACASGYYDDGNGAPGSPSGAATTSSVASRNPPVDCNYACTPTGSEICDGVDNDCNHVVDENQGTCKPGAAGGSASCPPLTSPANFCKSAGPCAGTKPQCSAAGTTTCGNSTGICWWCSYPSTCGASSSPPAACATLGSSHTLVEQSSPGVIVSEEDLCDGLDNDCDGVIDEAYPLAAAGENGGTATKCVQDGTLGTTVQVGVCQGSGTVACDEKAGDPSQFKAQICNITTPGAVPSNEKCNGLDDDCDGTVDEPWDDPAGTTRCSGSRCLGVRQAETAVNGDTGVSCVDVGVSCTTGGSCAAAGSTCPAGYHCGTNGACVSNVACGGLDCVAGKCSCPGVQTCSGGTCHIPAYYIDDYEASRPDAGASSGGSLDTLACSTAGVQPWTSVTEAAAEQACAASGMRLCDVTRSASGAITADEWGTACQYNAQLTYPYGNTYNGNTCNGADYTGAGAGSTIETGTLTGCANASLLPGVYDLSGNAKEWTDDPQTSGTTTVWTIRGGSYNSIQPGLTCGFTFDAAGASFLYADTGFRCCSSCLLPLVDCAGSCRDLGSDGANCGKCGNACASGTSCSNGHCCATGTSWSAGACR